MYNYISFIGQVFGRLTIIDCLKPDKHYLFKYNCECGKKDIIGRAYPIVKGLVVSCGCWKKEILIQNTLKHNLSGTPTYDSWTSMKQRCLNENSQAYSYYGGRGIQICERYKDSFEEFYKDMGDKPNNLSLDRIKNNLHYSCGKCDDCLKNGWKFNCRWATDKIQANNKRSNVNITYKGKTQTIACWAEDLNIKPGAILYRLSQGRSFEEIFLKEKGVSKYIYTINGITKTLKAWAKEYDTNYPMVYLRIYRYGWELIEALTTPSRIS